MNPNLWGDTRVSLHCLIAKQAERALYFLNRDCSQWLSDHNVPLYWTELIYGTLLTFFTLDQWWHRESCAPHQLKQPQRWIVLEGPCGVWAALDADWDEFCVDSQHSDHGLPEFTCFFRSMDTTTALDFEVLSWVFGAGFLAAVELKSTKQEVSDNEALYSKLLLVPSHSFSLQWLIHKEQHCVLAARCEGDIIMLHQVAVIFAARDCIAGWSIVWAQQASMKIDSVRTQTAFYAVVCPLPSTFNS